MGNSLNVPCNHPSTDTRRFPSNEILGNPAVTHLLESVSDYVRHQTEREHRGTEHRRHRHRRRERPQHASQESSPSFDDDGMNNTWRSHGQAESWLHDSWADSGHSRPRTYDHEQDSDDPFTHPRDHIPSPDYRSSRHHFRNQEYPARGPFDDDHVPNAARWRGDHDRGRRHHFSDTHGYPTSDNGVSYDSPPASTQHRHHLRYTELSPDRHQSRPRGFPRRHRTSSGSWPSRPTHRTPSSSVVSEQFSDGERSGFAERGRQRWRPSRI